MNHIVSSRSMDSPFYYLGISKNYRQSDILNKNFRKTSLRGYHQLRTTMSDTVLLTKLESYKDWRDEFYWVISDNAYYYPAM